MMSDIVPLASSSDFSAHLVTIGNNQIEASERGLCFSNWVRLGRLTSSSGLEKDLKNRSVSVRFYRTFMSCTLPDFDKLLRAGIMGAGSCWDCSKMTVGAVMRGSFLFLSSYTGCFNLLNAFVTADYSLIVFISYYLLYLATPKRRLVISNLWMYVKCSCFYKVLIGRGFWRWEKRTS